VAEDSQQYVGMLFSNLLSRLAADDGFVVSNAELE
jgi:hypothetical protein